MTRWQVLFDDKPYRDGRLFKDSSSAWRLLDRILARRPEWTKRLCVAAVEPEKTRSCPICGMKMQNTAPGYWNCKRDGDFTERFLDKM